MQGGNYSTLHISIRVPWHDDQWKGTVCKKPKLNNACLILPRIADTRNDLKEESVAGKSIEDLNPKDWPVCIDEHATFMSDFAYTRMEEHPYTRSSKKTHGHFKPTPFFVPKYSASAVPFQWMLMENFDYYQNKYQLDIDRNREPKLNFKSAWIQAYENQKSLLDCFFGQIKVDHSLCFFYSKRVPFTEKSGRVIIGVGRVKKIGKPVEYDYHQKKSLRGLIWERNIEHSIRLNFEDGFLLPYHQALEYLEENPETDFNPEDITVFTPDDSQLEFSYVSEHVTHDTAIETLLSCEKALNNAKEYLPGPWNQCIQWIDARLGELWKLRGPYPGLGSALYAFGISLGNFVANHITQELKEDEDPWEKIEEIFKNPERLPSNIKNQIGKNHQKAWQRLGKDRKKLLKLLSRFEISPEQAVLIYDTEIRSKKLDCTDQDLIENPYLIYELTRHLPERVTFKTIDHGVFPDPSIQHKYPLPEPSNMDTDVDERRVRALTLDILERAVDEGHTLLPQTEIRKRIQETPLKPPCNLNKELFEVAEEYFPGFIRRMEMADGSPAYQLEYLYDLGNKIRQTVLKRSQASRIKIKADWRRLLDHKLGDVDSDNLEEEEQARQEKTAALKEIAESRISVLLGSAGTGKTTLLSVLCTHPQIQEGGILLLAPTGKARVKLEQKISNPNLKAYTIAQFLNKTGGFNGETYRYQKPTKPPQHYAKTVIIDESSMLTEEMLGAVIYSIKGVQRLILVGDPNQLPPIGAGRPFVDIVNKLKPKNFPNPNIHVGPAYADLQIVRRQDGAERKDLALARWFTGSPQEPGEDEIFEQIYKGQDTDNIRLIQWNDPEELQELLLNIIIEELKEIKGLDDYKGFNESLGAVANDRGYYEYSPEGAENWQILSPVKNWPYGVLELNRLIHRTFRGGLITHKRKNRKSLNPLGIEELIDGDKVINVLNHPRSYYNPKKRKKGAGYLANGEIGIVKEYKYGLNVEFSSQPHLLYGFNKKEFGEESTTLIELAYALTVHKAQGSEFRNVFLILPNPNRMLSQELLYTALTRQKDKVIILHQNPAIDLKKYSDDFYSETAKRFTNLFYKPSPVEIEDRFFEDKLIHITKRGELVRSKSEVIIANLLDSNGIDYAYEEKLEIDGVVKYPDFTIHDDDLGIDYYWEHCGMMRNPNYHRRWENKKQWYLENDIIPYQQGGGEKGTLIITQDDQQGGISSQKIDQIIKKIILHDDPI